ncbi:MAG: efflux RND transporter periplasmic adaptor subunit, partial [Burkholderiaceae bacterium]|nr:efflux RND transporter periplasmic adaptor subunit [Burkholderiaceae bacterium]
LWLVVVLVIAGAAWFYFGRNGADSGQQPRYRTTAVTTGALVVKVSATGNLQPTNQVDVGSELSGIVEQVFVDDNDVVKKGERLARLDPSKLQDAVVKSRANLAAAEAQVLQAQATVMETRAQLARLQKVAELSGGKVPAEFELDAANANVKRAEANESTARASVAQARASLQTDETNLGKAEIRSPINGVVLSRKVQPGQTVAASLQAPVLFSLAEDLSKMELQVSVDEADVGSVKAGQKATFTVHAWPGRSYSALITRVGFGSQVNNGVVSYLGVLAVANSDLSLRQGMTGTADIVTLERDSALLVPNAALRFEPPPPPEARKKSGGNIFSSLMPRRRPQAPKTRVTSVGGNQKVWVLQDGKAVPVEVTVGATNGTVTEITGGALKEGAEVITELAETQP